MFSLIHVLRFCLGWFVRFVFCKTWILITVYTSNQYSRASLASSPWEEHWQRHHELPSCPTVSSKRQHASLLTESAMPFAVLVGVLVLGHGEALAGQKEMHLLHHQKSPSQNQLQDHQLFPLPCPRLEQPIHVEDQLEYSSGNPFGNAL